MKLKQLFGLVVFLLSFQSGIAQWKLNDTTPVPVCTAPDFQAAVLYSIDEDGNSYYVWSDYRKGVIELYVQKFNEKGIAQWEKDGLRIGKVIDQYAIIYTQRLIKPDGKGGAFVAWHLLPDPNNQGHRQFFAQHVSKDGSLSWGSEGVKVSDRELTTVDPYDDVFDLIDLKNDKLLVFFNHYNTETATNTVYTKKLDYSGKIIEEEKKLFENNRLEDKVIYDEKNSRFLALIKDNQADYLFQTFDANNTPLIPTPKAIYQNQFSGNSRIDLFKTDAEGNAVIGRTLTVDDRKFVYAHKVDITGASKWGNNGVNMGSDHTFDIQVVPTSDGGGIATWLETADRLRPFQIAKIIADGTIIWKKDAFVPRSDKPYRLPNKLVPDGKDGVYTLWLKPKDIGYELTVQHFDNNGMHRFVDEGISIKDFTFYSDYRLIPYPKGGVIVFWGANKELEDGRGGTVDLYTNYLTENGRFGLDEPPVLEINPLALNSFCAGQTFSVSVNTSGPNFNLDNSFKVLLSDKNGNFDNAIELGKDTRKTINVKTTQAIENGNYRIKVVSTSPVVESKNVVEVKIAEVTAPLITADKMIACVGETFTLTGLGCENGSVKWSNNKEGKTLAVALENTTTFSATCMIEGCKTSSSSNELLLQTSKVAATASNGGPFNVGESIKLTSTGGVKYTWSGPESFTSSEQNPTIAGATLNMGGIYTVVVTDNNNCTGQAQTTVQINNILALEEEVNIRTFPNPTSHEIIVEFYAQANNPVNVSLINMQGMIVGERKLKATGGYQQEVLDIRYFSRGQYLVKVITPKREVIKKVIIEN